jgi:hypothetical protein
VTGPGPHRRRLVSTVTVVVAVLVGGAAAAWVRHTAPPWPAMVGTAYPIALGADGCPVVAQRHEFVDRPGPLVPSHPSEVLLCVVPSQARAAVLVDPPRRRVLRTGAGDFAALLNRLPDRNTEWRLRQRRHGGWWPDPPHRRTDACLLIGYPYEYAFVLRYPDLPPVPLVFRCGGSFGELTSGARTRMDLATPHVVDEFVRGFAEQ